MAPDGSSEAIAQDLDQFTIFNNVGTLFSGTAGQALVSAPDGSASVALTVGGSAVLQNNQGQFVELLPGSVNLTSTTGPATAQIGITATSIIQQFNGVSEVVTTNAGMSVGTGAVATAELDVAGQFKLVNGTQAAARNLVSDAAGLSSWQPPTRGNIHFNDIVTPYILGPLAANAATPVLPLTGFGPATPDLTMPNAGLIRYGGPGPRVSGISATFNLAVVANFDYTFSFALNGIGLGTFSTRVRPDSVTQVVQVALTATLILNPGDIVNIDVVDPVGLGSIIITTFQLTVW